MLLPDSFFTKFVPEQVDDGLILLSKDRTGAVHQPGSRGQTGSNMRDYLLLYIAIVHDLLRIEEIKVFGCAAPGATARAGGVDKNELIGQRRIIKRRKGQVGHKGSVLPD